MALSPRVKRLVPFLAAGLLVPVIWSLAVVSLPETRLSTVQGATIVEARPGVVQGQASAEPVVDLTIETIVRAGQGELSAGDRVRLVVPAEAPGAGTVVPGAGTLTLAIAPTEDGEGFLLRDLKEGLLWQVQDQALTGALVLGLSSVGGAVLVGYTLGLPRHVRDPIPEIDAPPAVGGLATGLLLGALLAAGDRTTNLLFTRQIGGVPQPGTPALIVAAIGLVGALWSRRRVLPNGGRTATVGGLGLLLAPPIGLIMLWQGQLTPAHGLTEQPQFLAVLGALTVLIVAAARWLRIAWARFLTGGLLLAPPAFLLYQSTLFLGLVLPLVLLAASGARELFGPNLVAGPG